MELRYYDQMETQYYDKDGKSRQGQIKTEIMYSICYQDDGDVDIPLLERNTNMRHKKNQKENNSKRHI
eukprot:14286352-Ditylum_brightwellii.AAC.1